MKTTTFKLALGVAVLAGPLLTGTSAGAGDYNGGGLKGMRGTYVPVPAPAPIPEYAPRWYLRADVGAGFNVGMSTSERGMQYGENDLSNGSFTGYDSLNGPFGIGGAPFHNLSWDEGDDIGHMYGVGVGYYLSPKYRIDLTAEIRSEKKNRFQGNFQYDRPPGAGLVVKGDVEDTTTYRSSVFMANGYYDMHRRGRWNPYLGAGLGFAVNELRRAHRTDFSSCDRTIPDHCETPGHLGSYEAHKGNDYSFSLAASLMAGVTYRISDNTALDFNYRYLYVGGTDIGLNIGGHNSVMNIDDQHEHYLRAGLRWDIR